MEKEMVFYANKFFVAYNKKGNELVLTFEQEQPVYDNTGSITGVEILGKNRIVLTGANGKALIDVLSSCTNDMNEQE